MLPVGFEPSISACERPQTHALDRAATETGKFSLLDQQNDTLRSQAFHGDKDTDCDPLLRHRVFLYVTTR
jgi:hypothetical protein